MTKSVYVSYADNGKTIGASLIHGAIIDVSDDVDIDTSKGLETIHQYVAREIEGYKKNESYSIVLLTWRELKDSITSVKKRPRVVMKKKREVQVATQEEDSEQ